MKERSHRRVAVVSGGSRGIGRALVGTFLSAGVPVVTASRSQQALLELREAMETEHSGVTLCTVTADLSKKEGVDALVKAIPLARGTEVLLVHNVGVFLPGGVHNEAEGALEKMIETNLYSAYFLTRSLLPHMMREKSGHVFTICSTASLQAYPEGGAYCISKFALLGFTKVLREELRAYDIRVTAVLPGATLTDSWKGTSLPPTRFMPPEDIAKAVWDTYTLSARTTVEEIVMRPQLGDV